MQEGVRLTFKGIPQEKRRKIIETLEALGLQEINSQHDTHNDRHSHELHIGELKHLDVIEEISDGDFKVEAGVGC